MKINSWQQQLNNRLTTVKDIFEFRGWPYSEDEIVKSSSLPMFTTPYYASLIEKADFSDPIFAMTVPSPEEAKSEQNSCDPLEEEKYMPVPGLIRRYPDRAVYTATLNCASRCRHCTRRWQIIKSVCSDWRETLPAVLEYLKKEPKVEEIIISGGDPLTLPDDEIIEIISSLKKQGVKILRLGTRMPVTCPMRITDDLCQKMKAFSPIWIQTHFNHPREVTEEAKEALSKLADNGFPINNQTVLLKGVNDNTETLEKLFRLLVINRVRPYYLFQCDKIPGTEHFWTPLETGLKIIKELRERLSGIAIPTFIVDRPALDGKVPLSYATSKENEIVFSEI
ncbi:KamA family radical SAM protein [bacterium]|nr:KamA family radical SAM protein [bacterium]